VRVPLVVKSIFMLSLVALCLPGVSAQTSKSESTAVNHVRHLYFDQDEELARDELKDLVSKNPDDLELKAWFAVLGRKEDTQPIVSQMWKTDPESAWTVLASAAAFSNGWEKREQCEKAISRAPDNPDVLVLATRLLTNVLERPDDQEAFKTFQAKLTSFLENNKSSFEKNSQGIAARAQALNALERLKPNEARRLEIGELCDRALKLDDKNVTAIIAKAHLLSAAQKKKEAYLLLKSASQSIPDSYALHVAYWRSLLDVPGIATETAVAEITSDAGRLFAAVKPRAYMVFSASSEFGNSNSEALNALGDWIIKQFPDTGAADAVRLTRATKENPAMVAERGNPVQAKALEAFLDRPKHFDDAVTKSANEWLSHLLATSEHPDLDRLYKAVIDLGGDDSEGVRVLAEHKVRLPELELIAAKQLDSQWKVIYTRMLDQSDKQGFLDFGMYNWVSEWQSTLGCVYLNEGKLDEAQEKIEAAITIREKSAQNTILLGRVYESKGQPEEAQKLYTDALSMNVVVEGEHPAVTVLRESYVRRHGSTEGLDAYMKPLLAKDQERRKKEVLNARIKSSRPIPEFSLASLDGKTVTSESLKGKILVINFWATWCGPCRKELPDYDKFYQKYKDDPKVVVLTIATDDADTPQKEIQGFVSGRKYTFPVLLAPEWAKQNLIQPIPMTWFVDAKSNKVFQKIGYTKELMEEFTWRVEAMRNTATISTD